MQHAGVRPTGPTYNAVIAACVKAADLHATLAALQEMLAARVQLEVQTSISIIELCADLGQLEQAQHRPR